MGADSMSKLCSSACQDWLTAKMTCLETLGVSATDASGLSEACSADISGMADQAAQTLAQCGDVSQLPAEMTTACGDLANMPDPPTKASYDQLCASTCQDWMTSKATCLVALGGSSADMSKMSAVCSAECGDITQLPTEMTTNCGDLSDFEPTTASMDKLCSDTCQDWMKAKASCIAGLGGSSADMSQLNLMCAPCPRAIMPPAAGCEDSGDTITATTAAKPECQTYFCGMKAACPAATGLQTSPVPGINLADYTASIQAVTDNSNCPTPAPEEQAASSSQRLATSFALVGGFGAVFA